MTAPKFREAGFEQETPAEYALRNGEWIKGRRGEIPKVGPKIIIQHKLVEKIVYREGPDLSDTLAKMEAVAAKGAQPGANIPPAIKELMDDNLTDEQNVERLRQRWAALTNQQMAEAQKSNALPALTDAERIELTTLNSWDKLRGG